MKKFFTTLLMSSFILLGGFTSTAQAERKAPFNIKVGIIPDTTHSISFSTSTKGGIFTSINGKLTKIFDINAREACSISNKRGSLEVSVEGSKSVIMQGKLVIKTVDDPDPKYEPLVFAGEHWYRGYVEIFPSLKNSKHITVVNVVPLEEYLYGVVPSEMPSSWPLEALKTQAIAARTYVLKNMGQYLTDGFDVVSTVMNQDYGVSEDESPNSNQAVNETKGKVITYNNKLIEAYYYSSAGGVTESALDAWGSDIPYLKSVKDFDQDSPKYAWYKNITNEAVQSFIKKEYGKNIGKILNINVSETTASGRAKTVKIRGTKGSIDVSAKKMRMALKLNSTFFSITTDDLGTTVEDEVPVPELFLVSGKGFGHGSGMSQFGARFLAKSGKTYDEILKHYYQGVQIESYANLFK